MRIGFVSLWFERGQAYVTHMLRDVLATRGHECFVFARTGAVYGKSKLRSDGFWAVPGLTLYPTYQIRHDTLQGWIDYRELDWVIFNEEYDWGLVRAAWSTGVRVATYLDYYKDDWRDNMALYDLVLCSTQRSYKMARLFCNARYVGWAVDSNLFRPQPDKAEFTFFHNAGWLGLNYRKMTPAAILAAHLADADMLVHSQTPLNKLPRATQRIVRQSERIVYVEGTVPAPGLYHKGEVLVFPSKLEGLGLPLVEALACGMPVIATDAPPMNEFVADGANGLLVRVASWEHRRDGIAFPEAIVDVDDLRDKMLMCRNDPELVATMAVKAREYAETHLRMGDLGERIESELES